MGLRIRSNVASLTAQRHLKNSRTELDSSFEKLSSGYRINKSADDAAGLAISESLKANIRGLNQAKRNANDGVSLIQTAEGGLNEVGNIVVRLRELAIQSASDTVGDKERGFMNKEFMALKDEIDRISVSTEFNGTRLLIGNQDSVDSELTAGSNKAPLEIQIGKDYFNSVDNPNQRQAVNILRIDLQNINARTEGENSLDLGSSTDESGASVATKVQAQQSIARVDTAMTKLAGFRSDLGALQNRLMSSINNLGVVTENISAAKSRISDVDFAEETAKMTQANILQQSGVAVLSQANSNPQVALSLMS